MAKERLVSFDIARAVCIILVAIGHYVPEVSPSWWDRMVDVIYTFHMPAFFFISGYVYAVSNPQGSYLSFMKNKFMRLMVPYFTVSILVISLKLAASGLLFLQNPVGWQAYLRMFYLPEAGYFLWFIWALWWMFVVVRIRPRRQWYAILFAASIALWALPMPFTEVFCLEPFKRHFVFFMAGVIVSCYKKRPVVRFLEHIPFWCCLVLFGVSEYLYFLYPGKVQALVLAFIGVGMVLAFSKEMEHAGLVKRVMLSVSAASFMIYLLHTTFEGLAKALVLKASFFVHVPFVLDVMAVVCAGVMLPMLFQYAIVSKSRMLRLFFGLK